MSGIAIRPAAPSDAGLIFDLVCELAEYEKLRDHVVATEADLAQALFGEGPRVFCDVAEADGAPAGFALWFYTYSTFAGRHGIYLEDLYVRPAFRQRGIGKRLILNLAARAAREGCARLEWSVLDWNAPSIVFYEGLGAKPVTGWQVYRLNTEAILKLEPAWTAP